ncbi:MAG: trigger factor family protein [Patescibacteria group bacterium]
MKHAFKKNFGSIIHLEVELTPEEFKVYWQRVYDAAIGKVHIKGFRPGQAPKELAGQALYPEKIFEQAANDAVRFGLNELVEENEWSVIDKPKVTIEGDGNNFKYVVDLTVFPEVDLADYKKIAKKSYERFAKDKKEIIVSSEEIEKSLEFLKKSGADLKNFSDEEKLKSSIKDGLKIEKEERERDIQRLKVLMEIVKESKMDIPQVMIDRDKNIAEHLVIYKIAQLEKLEPTPEEVGEKVDNPKLYDYHYGVIQNQKVFKFLENL